LGNKVSHAPIQIFATDISERAIRNARIGEHPESIIKDVSPEKLSQHFQNLFLTFKKLPINPFKTNFLV